MSESSPQATWKSEAPMTSQIEPGTNVIGSCGHKIGEVMDVESEFLVVEEGFFICHDFYIPSTAISHVDKHGVHLNASKHDVKSAGWEREPSKVASNNAPGR